MTTEIAILNKSAVALAADSAITIGSKVYNSANKIFALSDYCPVGIMVYGNAEFLGIPWETIIKMYRSARRGINHNNIVDYALDFIKFVNSHLLLSSQEFENAYVRASLMMKLLSLEEKIIKKINEITNQEKKAIPPEEIINLINKSVASEIQEWQSLSEGESFDAAFLQECRDKYDEMITQAISSMDLLSRSEQALEPLKKLCFLMISRIGEEIDNVPGGSGLVVAGFGEKEIFPTYSAYLIEGKLNGRLKYSNHGAASISHTNHATIRAFAQKDMVMTFMEGCNPIMKKAFYQSVYINGQKEYSNIINSIPELSNEVKQKLINSAKSFCKELITSVKNDCTSYIQSSFIDPVIDAVAVLPKDELAALAESLVYITSLKRKISMGPETVGGPIDVAVISKGDGLVWIKRKQYFKADLNPQYAILKYREKYDDRKEQENT